MRTGCGLVDAEIGGRPGSGEACAGKMERLCYWEFDHFLTCPVVGTCLTFSEQQQVLKKAGVSPKKKTPFEIHEVLVASSEDENRVSSKVDHLLVRKYERRTKTLFELELGELMQKWRDQFAAGDYDAVLWAIASRPGLPAKYHREVFGAIHMAMHSSAEAQAQFKRRLASRDQTIRSLQERIKQAKQGRLSLKKERDRLASDIAGLERRLAVEKQERSEQEGSLALIQEQDRSSALQAENDLLRAQSKDLEATNQSKQRRISALQKENALLADQLDQQRELSAQFKEEAEWMLARFSRLNRCDRNCPIYDLCKKRILVVGGITRMESLYRQLIESSGGVFEHHDGYMKNGVKNLEGQLKRSDMIVCPVNYNSHAACSVVKNLSKKHRKPVYMLANSSLNAVSKVIWGQIADEGVKAVSPPGKDA